MTDSLSVASRWSMAVSPHDLLLVAIRPIELLLVQKGYIFDNIVPNLQIFTFILLYIEKMKYSNLLEVNLLIRFQVHPL